MNTLAQYIPHSRRAEFRALAREMYSSACGDKK